MKQSGCRSVVFLSSFWHIYNEENDVPTSMRIFSLQAKRRLVAATDCLSCGGHISRLVETRIGKKNFLLGVIREANYRLLENFSLNDAL